MAVKRSKALSFTILLLFFSEFLCGIALTAEDSSSKLENVIGIDFGTTNFCVAMYRYGSVQIIPNDQGNRITRSWVGFTDSVPLVTPSWIAFKRLIGKKFNDPEVQRDIKDFPYKVVNKEGKPYIEVKFKDEAKVFSPEEISAMILSKAKETAEVFLGKNITNAVLTVPAYFNDAQRQATKDAAKIAGLSVKRIINKPTAAAIAYNLDKKEKKMNILVYDLGGTTLEVSIVTFDNGLFEVKSTNGDIHLGGQDFDGRVMEHFIKSIRENYNKDITNDREALRKLHKKCESAKRGLSFKDQVQVEIEPLFDGCDFSEPLTREIFEDLNIDLFEKTIGSVKKALQDAGLNKTDIHEIVLAGGSSRIPKVRQLLKDLFDGKEPMKGVNPDEVVAYGAAYLDGSSSGEKGREEHIQGCSCCQHYNNMWQH